MFDISRWNIGNQLRPICSLGANILRDISGNIKLGDFGTSKRVMAITNQNQPDSKTIGKLVEWKCFWTSRRHLVNDPILLILQNSRLTFRSRNLGCTIVESKRENNRFGRSFDHSSHASVLTTGPPWQHLEPIAAIFHIATCAKAE